jgi:hypothetical protein
MPIQSHSTLVLLNDTDPVLVAGFALALAIKGSVDLAAVASAALASNPTAVAAAYAAAAPVKARLG